MRTTPFHLVPDSGTATAVRGSMRPISTRWASCLLASWRGPNIALLLWPLLLSFGCGGGSAPATPPPQSNTPTVPANFTATAVSTAQINLSWTASTDSIGVTGYQLQRCQGNSCSNFSQIATPTGTAFNDVGLTPGISYSYRVRAVDAAGNLSGFSTTASATTQPDTTPPSVPASLMATAVSSTQINLSWTASTDNVAVAGYQLQRCQGNGCSNFSQIATPTGTTFNDNTGLAPGTSYSYQVRATDAAGNLSGFSTTASATTQPVSGVGPTKIETTSSSFYNASSALTTWGIRLPNPTASGDTLVAACWWNDNTLNVAFSDDKANAWTRDTIDTSSTGGAAVGHASNVAANTTKITATFSGAGAGSGSCMSWTLNNIATASSLDATCGNSVASATGTCGSMSTTQANDFIAVFAACTNCSSPATPASFTAGLQGSGFTLAGPNGDSFTSGEHQTWASSGAINPSITLSGPTVTNMYVVGIALKTVASSGGAPGTGAYVQSVQHFNLPEALTPSGKSFTYQVPCAASNNTVAIMYQANPVTQTINSVTSSPPQNWTKPAGFPNASGPNEVVGGWYATGASPSDTMTITLTLNAIPDTTHELQTVVYCIGNTGGFDVAKSNFGSDASTTFPRTLTGVLSITPTTASGVIVFLQNEDSQICDSVNNGIQTAVATNGYQNIWADQDACIVHYYNPSASPVSFNTTYVSKTGSGSGNIGQWANAAMAFKAP